MILDPEYARFCTKARIICWQYGYALTLHGSYTRDLDLVMIPWEDRCVDALHVITHLANVTKTKMKGEPGVKPHGRLAYTLYFPGFGDPRWVDLSVMPRVAKTEVKTAILNEPAPAVRSLVVKDAP